MVQQLGMVLNQIFSPIVFSQTIWPVIVWLMDFHPPPRPFAEWVKCYQYYQKQADVVKEVMHAVNCFCFFTKDQKWLTYLIPFRLHARITNRMSLWRKENYFVRLKQMSCRHKLKVHSLNILLVTPSNS